MRQSILYKVVGCIFLISLSLNLAAQKGTSKNKKEGKENSGISNKFQDLTARYNGYFNAKILLQQSLQRVNEKRDDNYEELLNVFAYNNAEDAAITGDMDAILKKASKAIQRHPNAKWVDDCYLLIGQANFFKGNYQEAAESFQFINRRFKYGIRKTDYQKKGKREKDKKGITFNIGGLTNEDGKVFDREERQKQNEERKKELEKQKQEREKEMAQRQKDKQAQMKQREKERAAKAKEKAKITKQKQKERQRKLKWKQKNIKRKKQGKPALPYKPKYTFEKKQDNEATEVEEAKNEEPEVEELAEESKEEEAKPEEQIEEADTTNSEYSSFVLKEDGSNEKQEVKYKDNFFSFLFHRPAKHEATVWLARTFMAMDNKEDAIAALEYARENENMPRKFRPELNGLIAQYHLDNENYDEAYVALNRAIDDSRKKSVKARYHYIQAQLSEKDKNYDATVSSFKKVLKTRPPYEMGFNARLGLVKNQIAGGKKTPDEGLKYLERMLKDDKNFDNQDKIYYAMSDIAIHKLDVELALDYLEKSAENSTVNKEQKAKTYLKIADLYYELEQFLQASAYYDSSLIFLPKSYPNYNEIVVRKDVLTDLAAHVATVELEDSLQRLANLPEAVRNEIIDELIAKMEKEAEEEQAAISVTEIQNNDPNNIGNNAPAGSFYFYNPNSVSNGKLDFKRVWGERPLVDNWRRQAAIPAISGTATDNANEEELKGLALEGLLTRDMFLSAIPFDKEAKEASNKKIMESLYQIGFIYDEKLNHHEKAIPPYEELLDRFPDNPKATETHFALYNIYKEEGNIAEANKHKNYIKQNDPDSQLADVVSGGEKSKESFEAITKYYDQTYQQYLAGDYENVLERVKNTETMFAMNSLQAEFDLLEAYTIGKTREVNQYISALKNVSENHQGHKAQQKADEILSYLDAEKKAKIAENSIYSFKEGILHYYIIAMDGYTKNITQAINNISDFNSKNFSADKIKVTQMLLDKDHPIILIKSFKTADNARLYEASIKSELADMLAPIEVPTESFIISKPNFNTYFKDKNLSTYLEFYNKTYKE